MHVHVHEKKGGNFSHAAGYDKNPPRVMTDAE